MKDVLASSGADVSRFKGHSTRSASTSRADVAGASVSDILGQSRWSKQSTCQYNKPIISKEKQFQALVLSGKLDQYVILLYL